MKILVHVPVMGRHYALSLFAENCFFNGFTDVIAMVSNPFDEAVCNAYNFDTIMVSNTPFGSKLQAGLNYARSLDFDALLCMGCDNTIHGIEAPLEALQHNEFVGYNECKIHDIITDEYITWYGYTNFRKGEPVGAGRFYKRSLLEKLNWNLWGDIDLRHEDFVSWQNIQGIADGIKLLDIADSLLIDHKDPYSASPFDHIKKVIS